MTETGHTGGKAGATAFPPFQNGTWMKRKASTGGRGTGFTMVELLVVLAIVGILMGLAVPMTRMFFQGTQERGARELYSLLRAARVYAATYRVNTAVAYEVMGDVPDTLLLPDPNGPASRTTVQVLRGAMMVYELPSNRGAYAGYYTPVPGWDGFRPFPTGYCVLLQAPPERFDGPPASEPGIFFTEPDPNDRKQPRTTKAVDSRLGLDSINLLTTPVEIEGVANLSLWDSPPAYEQGEYAVLPPHQYNVFLAHRFDQTGQLIPPGSSSEERYRILFAPMPDQPRADRLVQLGNAEPEDSNAVAAWRMGSLDNAFSMIGIPIEIYRSTGRVEMGKL